MTAGISHFAIKVRDLAAAERFYCDVLGLAVQRRWPQAPAPTVAPVPSRVPRQASGREAGMTETTRHPDRSLWLDSGDGHGTFLALERASEEPGTVASSPRVHDTEHGGHHLLALRIAREQRGMFESKLAAAGVAISGRTAYTIYFTDPEGNRLGLSHYPDPLPDWETASFLDSPANPVAAGTAGGGPAFEAGDPT